MIDILVALTAFLLITAVWSSIGVMRARQPDSRATEGSGVQPERDELTVVVQSDGFRVGYSAADTETLAGTAFSGLRRSLQARHAADPSLREVWISPDSNVPFDRIAHAMDTVQDVWRAGGGEPCLVRLR